jgi:hypothetical protein
MSDPLPLAEVVRRVLQLPLAQQRRAVPLVAHLCRGALPAQGPVPTILELMDSPGWFGSWFHGDSWDAWKAFLAGVFGLPMTPAMLRMWQACTQRQTAPTEPADEAAMVVGRRGGKSRIAAFSAVYLACFRDYRPHLCRGEWATIPVISADAKESRTVMRYVKAFLEHPRLKGCESALKTDPLVF